MRKISAAPTLQSRPHQTLTTTKAKLVPAHTREMVTEAEERSGSTPIRDEDRHVTTFAIQWGPHGLKVALREYVEYPELLGRIKMPIERMEKMGSESLAYNGRQDLENHRRREFGQLAIMDKQGAPLGGNRPQSCEKTGDFGGRGALGQELRTPPNYLEPAHGPANQAAWDAQPQDTVPTKLPPPSRR